MIVFKELKKRIFPLLVALSALSVSASAAFYSVTGLSKLFAGASLEVFIMASSLEIAKLIIASFLYQYWDKINRVLRTYLTLAAFILIVVTSMGIYGFLSAAYQETATKSNIVDKEIGLLNLKKERFEEDRTFLIEEKTIVDESISSLRNGLSNNVIQYKDSETGEIITTTSSSTRRVLQSQLDDAVVRRDNISNKLTAVTDSITTLDLEIFDIESNSDVASELGPLKYISELTDTPMASVVNYLFIILVFVFDPLAIALVISANFLFDRLTKKDEEDVEDNTEDDIKLDKKTNDLSAEDIIIEVKEQNKPKTLVYKSRNVKN